MNQLTEEQFLKQVAKHQMEILRDDGVYRHVRFAVPGTSCMHFDLVTWPGYLNYSGDMGCYTFSRLFDMFQFFRTDREYSQSRGRQLSVDHSYWAEKIQSTCRADGTKEFSKSKFDQIVAEYIASRAAEDEPDDDSDVEYVDKFNAAYRELRTAVDDEVLSADSNDVRCYDAANEFSHSGEDWQKLHDRPFEFQNLWEYDSTEYTHRFQWCCFALAWGIQKYDDYHAANTEGNANQVAEVSA